MNDNDKPNADTLSSLIIGQLAHLTGQVASGAKELAKAGATMASLWGDGWVKDILLKTMDTQRLEAMADAGHFLRDAREVAGLNIAEMADALGLEIELLEDVERGDKLLPFEGIFRAASLIARHDPIPFIIKFLRTYNPALEEKLESLGLAAIPKQYERERRFINLYRKHDSLRALSDNEFERVIGYSDNMINLVLDVMSKEQAVAQQQLDAQASAHQEQLALVQANLKAMKRRVSQSKAKAKKKTKATSLASRKSKSGASTRNRTSTKARPKKPV